MYISSSSVFLFSHFFAPYAPLFPLPDGCVIRRFWLWFLFLPLDTSFLPPSSTDTQYQRKLIMKTRLFAVILKVPMIAVK